MHSFSVFLLSCFLYGPVSLAFSDEEASILVNLECMASSKLLEEIWRLVLLMKLLCIFDEILDKMALCLVLLCLGFVTPGATGHFDPTRDRQALLDN